MTRHILSIAVLFLIAAASLSARVISYSPYTDRPAVPLHQSRMNRHFVLIESGTGGTPTPGFAPIPYVQSGQLVIYDFLGEKEPRVIFPPSPDDPNALAPIGRGAVRENSQGLPSILIQTFPGSAGGENAFQLTVDGGTTWKRIAIPSSYSFPTFDAGGPFAVARYSPIRTGTEAYPFVVASGKNINAIGADASVRPLLAASPQSEVRYLSGRNEAGTRFLVVIDGQLSIVDLDGNVRKLDSPPAAPQGAIYEGWITSDDSVYVEERMNSAVRLWHIRAGSRSLLKEAPLSNQPNLFAVPTYDYEGAWIIERGAGKPTSLYRHDASGLVKQWEDITAPEVEAIHTGSSGTKLLVQVHRPRPQPDQRIFQDPALAIWNVGESAPRFYDELFMNEQATKGFVHLDVEKVAQGEAFVFDSGTTLFPNPGPGLSPAVPVGGGGDVVQEWGVVRASLRQRLVIPSVGRTAGAFGSFWSTDVILHNPLDTAQRVDIRFVPNGEVTIAQERVQTLTLRGGEIRLIEDALQTLFSTANGTGAFFLTPASGISATSRTYSRTSAGTFGFGMNAIDIFAAAASARFPVSFSGAFLGSGYRTNLVLTDASTRGTETQLFAAGGSGFLDSGDIRHQAPPSGQQQFNSIGPLMGMGLDRTGALLVRPTRGHAIVSVFVVDNRTNDPTYFPPDLPAPVVRTIPAIGHLDGANNSRFRTDLYLFNPSSRPSQVVLQIKAWDAPDTAQLRLTLLGNEARVIEDVLMRAFGRTGIARLRYQSDTAGVRVTSRTYNIDSNGGTFGFLMPPLNNFQSGGSGDTLEILGAVADDRYRTNIGLVELTGFSNGQASVPVRIEIISNAGAVLDSFTVTLPVAGGMQLNDVFRARSLNYRGAALIRVSPQSGVVGAYATHIDQGTNDASYLAANLSAKQ